MKRYNILLSTVLVVVFLLAACGEKQVVMPSSQAATEPPVGLNTPTEASALPIDLSGPPPGTPMVWVDGSILVHVPGSEFIMGGEGTDNPVHKVGLSSFWIYRTKVTNRMYAYCVAAGKCAPPKDPASLGDFSNTTLRDVPVAGVDWEQGDIYCKFVEGRLPTEAEWEKTARGTDGNVYPWGDAAPGCTLLNFNGDCVGKKTKVFDYPTGKSFYTALDMAGNAFEWTSDWYDPNYYGASPVADPVGPETGTVRTVRGSSYQVDQTQVPSYRRFFLDPKIYRQDLGFRCVIEDPHPFAPLCSQILVPGKLGNENLGGQPADPNSCEPPVVEFEGECASTTGTVTNGVLDSIEGGNCLPTGTDSFFCSGTGSANAKVCIECPDLEYPQGGGCGIGQFLNTVAAFSCDSKGQPAQCPTGFIMDTVNQCCTVGPGISYPGCGPGETLDNNQCIPGQSKKPGCEFITVDLTQGCPTCQLTAASCNASCKASGAIGGNLLHPDCVCECIQQPSCTLTAAICNASCGKYGGNLLQPDCVCDCLPPPSCTLTAIDCRQQLPNCTSGWAIDKDACTCSCQ